MRIVLQCGEKVFEGVFQMKRCLLLLASSVGISAIGGVDVSVVPQMPWGKCVDVWVTLSDVKAETEYTPLSRIFLAVRHDDWL